MQICKKLQLVGTTGALPLDPTGGLPSLELASVYSRPLWGNFPPPPPKKILEIPPKQIRQDWRTRGTKSWLDDTDKNLVPICLYCLNCTKFGQLILRKIIKTVATRCQILRLKCTKFDFGCGSAPDLAGGYSLNFFYSNWFILLQYLLKKRKGHSVF